LHAITDAAVENASTRVTMAVLIVPTAAKEACGNRAKLLDVTPRRIRLTRGQVMRVKSRNDVEAVRSG
jgi:hypothetical protein